MAKASWALLAGLLLIWMAAPGQSQEVRVLRKHNGPVKALAISRNDKILATGGADRQIILWDPETGQPVTTLENPFAVGYLRFFNDTALFVASGTDIRLIDLQGKLIRHYGGYTTDIWSLDYNATEGLVAAGSYSKNIRLWDLNTGETVRILEGHEKSCLPVCFNPDGRLIASGSLDKTVRLWNAATGQENKKLEIHTGNIFCLAFHPSGKYIASGSADKTIRLWNVDNGRVVRTYTGHTGSVMGLAFTADGHHLLSCSDDKTVILWETFTGRKLNSFTGHVSPVNQVCLSNDNSFFATASEDKTVIIWPLEKRHFVENLYAKEIEEEMNALPLKAMMKAGSSISRGSNRPHNSSMKCMAGFITGIQRN
jgi:hypothetical protein